MWHDHAFTASGVSVQGAFVVSRWPGRCGCVVRSCPALPPQTKTRITNQ